MDLWTLSDLCLPWCIRVVATLRVAEHMAAGVSGIDELAAAAKCNRDVLRRMLGYLASKGIFEQPEPGRFRLNEAAQGFLEPATMLGLDLDGIGGRMSYAWGTLLSFARTGRPAYHEAFGLPFWEDLEAHPAVAESFDALIGPAGHGDPNAEFEISGGWDRVRTLVDVGGGTGAMLAAILKRWPHLHGTLVELPRTAARSAEIFRAAGVEDRVTVSAQSFFDPLPAGADLYLLRGVLNNWPEPEAAALLTRCAEAARPGGRVVILKSVGDDDAPNEVPIEMVLLGGRRRSIDQFRALAARCGLRVIAAGKQSSGVYVVECGANSGD
jgi:SAM-dependent methyltransferase